MACAFSCASFANGTQPDYRQHCEQVNQNPWESYQKLILLETVFEQTDLESRLRYLLCKAQAENLLYFYPKFNATVEQAAKLLHSNTPVEIVSTIRYYQGLVFQRAGSYDLSTKSFEQAISLSEDSDLDILHITALQELAYTKSLTSLYVISFNKIREALVKAQQLNDPFLLAMINESYGAIYGFLGDYKTSIKHYEYALENYQLLGFRPYEAEAIYGLASTYRYWKKYDTAIKYFNQYIEKTAYTPNSDVTFFGLYGLGMTLAEKGMCNQAIESIANALAVTGAADYKAELYKREASCYVQLGQIAEAKISLQKAISIFSQLPELKDSTWELETIKIRSEIASASDKHQLAYQLSTSYYEQYTQLLAENSSEQLSNLRSNFELASRDAMISNLQHQATVQQLEAEQHIEQSKTQQFTLIIAVSIIFIVLIAFIFQRKLTKKIFAISVRDSLTGLYNRRYIFDHFDKLINSLENTKAKLSIILLDIDNFKNINDQYGHPFGDIVIEKVSKICQETLRGEDVMGRIGGEEFLCLLPRINEKNCLNIASRMIKNVAEHTFVTDKNNHVKITISIGITSSSNRAKTRSALLIQADKALYQSKDFGKNRVTNYAEIT